MTEFVIKLADERGRELSGLVERGMGGMSHRRLSQKADLYAAYFAAGAWRERHRFCPAVCPCARSGRWCAGTQECGRRASARSRPQWSHPERPP